MSSDNPVNRRDFLRPRPCAGALHRAGGFGICRPAGKPSGRVIGANDKINVGVIGVGGRGTYVASEFQKAGEKDGSCRIAAVCDVYEKRKKAQADKYGVKGYLDYRELLAKEDVDAVIVATPDHWHATIALAAMDGGRDVYLEKPMCHTIEEAKRLVDTVKETKRVLQVGSQTTSGDQWHKARK